MRRNFERELVLQAERYVGEYKVVAIKWLVSIRTEVRGEGYGWAWSASRAYVVDAAGESLTCMQSVSDDVVYADEAESVTACCSALRGIGG